jgi:hypothetical protein
MATTLSRRICVEKTFLILPASGVAGRIPAFHPRRTKPSAA